jgi:hypothetical protein
MNEVNVEVPNKTKNLVINLTNNRYIRLIARQDVQSCEWVIKISDEMFNDITEYSNSNWYTFDESSSIRVE